MANLSVTTTPTLGKRNQLSTTLLYFFVFVLLGLVGVSYGPAIPSLAEQTRSDLSQISFIFMARSVGSLLGSLWLSRWYDRLPGHRLMALWLGLTALTLALTPLLGALWLLLIVILVLGMVEGTLHAGGNTLLVWVHGSRVGPYMNGLHFFFGIGAFLAPLIVAQLMLLTGSIRGPFWLLALLILPAIVWLARLPSPASPAPQTGSRARPVSRPVLALFILFFFLYVGLEVSYSGWIYTYTLEMGLAGQATAAYLTSAFWGAITLGRLLNVALAIRFSPQAILYTDLGGAVLCTGLMVAWPDSATALWLGTIGLGLCLASVFSSALALAERRMPITGRTTGLFLVGASLGAMCLPWLVGQLIEPVGPPVLMMTIIAALLVALGVLIGLDRFSMPLKKKDRKDLKGSVERL